MSRLRLGISPRHPRVLHGLGANNLARIRVVRDVKLAAQVLGADERQHNHVRVHAAHEDADDLAVVVPAHALGAGRQREVLAQARLDG